MSDFKTWFDKEYPLPEGYGRGPIGRDFMNGCEKAYKAGKAELQAELAAAKEAFQEIRGTMPICCDGNPQGDYACDTHQRVAVEFLERK